MGVVGRFSLFDNSFKVWFYMFTLFKYILFAFCTIVGIYGLITGVPVLGFEWHFYLLISFAILMLTFVFGLLFDKLFEIVFFYKKSI